MNKKLNDEEYHAFLHMFDGSQVQFRRLSVQSGLFRRAFYFVNAYTLLFVAAFFIVSRLFVDFINQDVFTESYVSVLNARAYISLWLIAAINISYFFSFYFRFFVVAMLMYLLNATIDQTLLFYQEYKFTDMPIIFIFFFTRPFLVLSLLILLWKYKEQ